VEVADELAQGECIGGGADVPNGGFGVDLGGAQRGVPEEFLHDGGGFAQADELHGYGVPEGVRRGPARGLSAAPDAWIADNAAVTFPGVSWKS